MVEENNPLKDGLGITSTYEAIIDNINYHGDKLENTKGSYADSIIYHENSLNNYNKELTILLKKGEDAI